MSINQLDEFSLSKWLLFFFGLKYEFEKSLDVQEYDMKTMEAEMLVRWNMSIPILQWNTTTYKQYFSRSIRTKRVS